MTNQTTRRHQELRLPIGLGADGKPQHIIMGWLLETDWGAGRKSYDAEICLSHLQPVIFQQVKQATGGTATVVCDKADFAKRYKVAVKVPPMTEPVKVEEDDKAHPQPSKNPSQPTKPTI